MFTGSDPTQDARCLRADRFAYYNSGLSLRDRRQGSVTRGAGGVFKGARVTALVAPFVRRISFVVTAAMLASMSDCVRAADRSNRLHACSYATRNAIEAGLDSVVAELGCDRVYRASRLAESSAAQLSGQDSGVMWATAPALKGIGFSEQDQEQVRPRGADGVNPGASAEKMPKSAQAAGDATFESMMAAIEKLRDVTNAEVLERVIAKRKIVAGKCFAPNGVLVAKGAELVLKPGAVLVMGKGSQIQVAGDLSIQGRQGHWVTLCCQEKGSAAWKGILVDRAEGEPKDPLSACGLLIADAERGIDVDAGVSPGRAFEIRDSIFAGNSVGVWINRFGLSGAMSSPGSIDNCLFIGNVESGAWLTKIADVKARVTQCTFRGNAVGITCNETARDVAGVIVAERSLFSGNKVGVFAAANEGAVASSWFEANQAHIKLDRDVSALSVDGNFWGPEATRQLEENEGARSGEIIGANVRLTKWLTKPPKGRVGAQLTKVPGGL